MRKTAPRTASSSPIPSDPRAKITHRDRCPPPETQHPRRPGAKTRSRARSASSPRGCTPGSSRIMESRGSRPPERDRPSAACRAARRRRACGAVRGARHPDEDRPRHDRLVRARPRAPARHGHRHGLDDGRVGSRADRPARAHPPRDRVRLPGRRPLVAPARRPHVVPGARRHDGALHGGDRRPQGRRARLVDGRLRRAAARRPPPASASTISSWPRRTAAATSRRSARPTRRRSTATRTRPTRPC